MKEFILLRFSFGRFPLRTTVVTLILCKKYHLGLNGAWNGAWDRAWDQAWDKAWNWNRAWNGALSTLQSLTGKYRGLQGNPCNENRDPAMRAGVPCNENRFFPVGIDSQGICKKIYF